MFEYITEHIYVETTTRKQHTGSLLLTHWRFKLDSTVKGNINSFQCAGRVLH